MALWASLLARQDLGSRGEPVRLLLYGLGLVLTFNLGRDITLLVLYPFFFGSLLFWWWSRFVRKSPRLMVPSARVHASRSGKTTQPGAGEGSQRRHRSLRPIPLADEVAEPISEPFTATGSLPPKTISPLPGESGEDDGGSDDAVA